MNETIRRRLSIALCVVGVLGALPYRLFPILEVGKFCPATTFGHGPMASSFLMTGGFFLSMVSYMYLASGLWPKKDEKPRYKIRFLDVLVDNHWRSFIATTLGGFLIGSFILFDCSDSYYCLIPSGIISHPSVFTYERLLNWSDVTAVRSECLSSKSGSFGRLVISFKDGHQIPVSLAQALSPEAVEYMGIRSALSAQSYVYSMDSSVSPSICPRNIYLWFTSQLHRTE